MTVGERPPGAGGCQPGRDAEKAADRQQTAAKPAGPDRAPLLFIAAFAIAWSLLVIWLVACNGGSSAASPLQGLWAAAPLAVVGAVICALGYMSMLRRRAMRRSRSSLERLLEQRRQKHL